MVSSGGQRSLTKVITGSIYLGIDNILILILGSAFWFLVAKMVPPEGVGQATMAESLGATFLIFTELGLGSASSKYIAEYNAKGQYVASRSIFYICLKLIIIMGIISAIVLSISSGFISTTVYHTPALVLLIFGAALALPFQGLDKILHWSYQGFQRMEFCAIGDSTYQIVRLISALVLVSFGLGALGIVFGFVSGYIASSLLGVFLLSKKLLQKRSTSDNQPKGLLRQILNFSLPNYASSVLVNMNSQISFLIIGMFSITSVAFYNIAFLIITIIYGVSSSLALALLPTVSEEWVNGKKQNVADLYNLAVRLSLILAGPISLAVLLFPNHILSLISLDYVVAAGALQILTIGTILNIVAGSSNAVLNGIGRPRAIMMIGIFSAILGIIINILFIPNFGMMGAAIAFVAASSLSASLGIFILKDKERLVLEIQSIYKPLLCLVISFFVGYYLFTQWGNLLLTVLGLSTTYMITIWFSRAITKDEAKTLLLVTKSLLRR